MNTALLKSIAVGVASTALAVASELFDKGAELADEAKTYLDEKDTTGREARKEKRTSILGFDKKSHDSSTS